MIVKVEFLVMTDDYETETFKKEVKQLVEEIDPYAKVMNFNMKEIKKEDWI